jgi:hypothetical protein
MRTTSFRLLFPALSLLAGACDDSDSPFEPPPAEQEVPAVETDQPSLSGGRWADGYLTVLDPAGPAKPPATLVYNRSGGRITLTRPTGTTGRYIATFTGLSAVLGAKSTVQVTGYSLDNAHCKPVNGVLVNDKVEVRCFNSATGAPAEAAFSLVVLRKSASRAFAYANQPTSASYSPQASGSWNPSGTTKVTRLSTGYYQVHFNNLGAQLSSHGGHVQVSAVGAGSAYCKLSEEWGGSPNLSVVVQCYTLAGQPADAKFTVLFQRPAAHLAYAYANQPTTARYSPGPFWSSNPTGGSISVQRASTGVYFVDWQGVAPAIIDLGNIQVTALGFQEYAQCKIHGFGDTIAGVRCFAPNGTLVDVAFTVLLGS